MTHMRQMAEHEGKRGKAQKSARPCPKCQRDAVTFQVWESSDGAYEDVKFTCGACKHVWWVDGIDS